MPIEQCYTIESWNELHTAVPQLNLAIRIRTVARVTPTEPTKSLPDNQETTTGDCSSDAALRSASYETLRKTELQHMGTNCQLNSCAAPTQTKTESTKSAEQHFRVKHNSPATEHDSHWCEDL